MSRLADDVLRRLRDDIVAGTYPPGQRLTEQRLCSTYAVSRVPVREALKQLEVEGFVEARAYAGVRVARMAVDEAEDLFTVRRTIETLSVVRCARRFRAAPQDDEVRAFRAQLEEVVASGAGAVGAAQPAELPRLNTRFHLSLAAFSQSASLLALLRQVAAKIEWLYAMDVDERGEHSWAEHREITAAVVAGDARAAARLMGRHIDRSREGYLARHARVVREAVR